MEHHSRLACGALLLVGLASSLAGCDEPSSAKAATRIEPEVGIISVKARPRALVHELPGRIAATRIADVRPRISGIVVERMFHQGSEVKAGDPLYRIDQRPLEVELRANEASLARAAAAFDLAAQQEKRITLLVGQKVVSEAEHEKAVGTFRQAEADVAARRADVARARLKLNYATIRAPIDGVVGAALVSEGALVVQNESNLATIQQLDPIYADFTQSVSEMNRLRRAFAEGDLNQISPTAARVRLVLDEGTIYPIPGKLLFSESRVDAHTGQVTMRAEFPNPKRELLPGMYVRVLVEQGVDEDAITVPQQAVQRNAGGDSEVFLVRDDGRVVVQPVRLGEAQGGLWLVDEGLREGDRVVVDGFQKFAPGDKVRQVPFINEPVSADAFLGHRLIR
jgi:membrane fusion protein, multidrug efflux system